MTDPENVASFEKYRPAGKTYKVALNLSGAAGEDMSELMTRLNTENPNEVVLRAIALLISAQGKDILLRDRKTGASETVDV